MRCIKVVKPSEIFVDKKNKEFCYYKYRNGKRKNYTYKVTFLWDIWEDALKENNISWNDFINRKVEIREYGISYPFGKTRFIKI